LQHHEHALASVFSKMARTVLLAPKSPSPLERFISTIIVDFRSLLTTSNKTNKQQPLLQEDAGLQEKQDDQYGH
jgi:hypothetical protein